MNFLNADYHSLEQKPQLYSDNYQSNYSPFSRFTAILHSLGYLINVKRHINNNVQTHKPCLTDQQLTNIKYEESSEYLAEKIAASFEKVWRQKQEQNLTSGDVFKLVIGTFKMDFIKIILLYLADAVLRLAISVLIIYLLYAVNNKNTTQGFIYVAIICVIWYCNQVAKQTAFLRSYVLASKIKSALAMLLYSKISSLTSYVIKSEQLGKITNLLASDLGVIQARLATFLSAFCFPVFAVGSTVLLIIRLGWPGVFGILFVLISVPLTNCVSKKNGGYIQQINVFKDKRIQTTSQVIEGIKFIKLYGWEIAFRRIIQNLRDLQISNYKYLSFGRSIERALGMFIGVASGYIMYLTSHYANTGLDLAKIFSCLQVVFSFRYSIFMFILGVGFYHEVTVVFGRFSSIFSINNVHMVKIDPVTKQPIDKKETQPHQVKNKVYSGVFEMKQRPKGLQQESLQGINIELQQKHVNELNTGQILFKGFNGYWKHSFDAPSLVDINLFFQRGVFYGITGRVGSGKSGLLGVILKEIPYFSGKFESRGSVSYVEQEPIIFSDTVRNNILFGLSFDEQRYARVVDESCLAADFEILEDGDETIVGEKGITLSGGQKARLALARALYADSDIFVFDDPISAVDSKVAREIHEKCLKKLSKTKTLILVTHQIGFLYDCDQVIIMEDGRVRQTGHPSELTKELREMSALFKKSEEESPEQTVVADKLHEEQKIQLIEHVSSMKQSANGDKKEGNTILSRFVEKQFMVSLGTYTRYIGSSKANYILFPISIILFVASELILTFFLRFLANYEAVQQNLSNPFGTDFSLYWGILGLLIMAFLVVLILKYFTLYLTLLNSNRNIHEEMVNGIVRSPGAFFDVTPSGVLINKFSNDLGILDNSLAICLIDTLEGPTSIVIAMVNIAQIYLYFVPAVVVVFVVAILFFNYARAVIVQCKQMDLKNKNPIFQAYSETISGLVQIKTYGRRRSLIQQFSQVMNRSTKAAISFDLVSRGFGFYEAFIGLVLIFIGMNIGVSQSGATGNGLFGVTLIFLFNFGDNFQWFLRQIITAESLMISYERANQITSLAPEKELRRDYDRRAGLEEEVVAAEEDRDLHTAWPEEPSLEFKNLSARYKPGLPLVVKDLSFTVERHSKVGIVGRTGAGKSSIIQAIFRIIEPEAGSQYTIGNHDALEMGLHSLRQHVSVIPQTPFLFKGSVKQNVDPFSTASDEQIWAVLQESGLYEHVQSLPKKLKTDISNTSESFSVGQKQLLCLARALLRRNKFLVLDEATSNVDMETDSFIQAIIKDKFRDTTVITIAHRLNTIADYDKIIVLKNGRIIEMGAPYELILRQGTFFEMVGHTGKNAALITSKAKASFESKRKGK